MSAPQPRPRRLPRSPSPSAPAFGSRPSAAPRAAPRVRSRRTGARACKTAGATGSSRRARATAACRSAPAAPSSVGPAKCERRRGSSAKPPSSSSEECGWQEDVWQLTFFARARAGCRARDWQEGGGQAPKGAVLLELDERGADLPLQPLREPGAAQAPRVGEAFVRTTISTSTAASRMSGARSRPQRLRPVTPGPPHNRRTACLSLHRLRQLFDCLWNRPPWRCFATAPQRTRLFPV